MLHGLQAGVRAEDGQVLQVRSASGMLHQDGVLPEVDLQASARVLPLRAELWLLRAELRLRSAELRLQLRLSHGRQAPLQKLK